MKVYPIKTGTVRVKAFQLTGAPNLLSRFYQLLFTQKWSEWLPIYCWLIAFEDELILIDTGESPRVNDKGFIPSGGLYHKAVQTVISREDDISQQLAKLGFKTQDISTVVLTHLHGDHIGGVEHFPQAQFYVSRTEYEFATGKKGAGNGYFVKNWPSWFKPNLIEYDNTPVGCFDTSFQLPAKANLQLVPTPEHSVGHQSVILNIGERKYFVGGDLTYNLETLEKGIPNVILPSKEAYRSVNKARTFVKDQECIFLSSHDWNAPQLI